MRAGGLPGVSRPGKTCAGIVAAVALVVTGFVTGPATRAEAVSGHETAYVEQVFDFFLDRGPTRAESSQAGATSMTTQQGRARLLENLTTSVDWYVVAVTDMYRQILRRDVDLAGLNYWVHALGERGVTLDRAQMSLYASSEYVGGRSTGGWVDRLYQDLLDRDADPGGHAYWVRVARSRGPSPVVASFHAAPEPRNVRITDAYSRVLGRAPDPAGLEYWSKRILDRGQVDVLRALAATDEAYGPLEPGERVVGPGPAPLPEQLAGNGLTRRLITVRSSGWSSTTGELSAWERSTVGWKRVFGPWRSHNGYSGWRPEQARVEGDGTTPAGRFGFLGGFGLRSDPGYRLGWFVVDRHDYWAGDPSRSDYNTHQRGPSDPALAPWRDHEHLIDHPVAYRYSAVIDFNMPVTGPRGSAIFLHVSTGGHTAGCVSLTESRLVRLLPWIDAGTEIVMGPDSAIRSY